MTRFRASAIHLQISAAVVGAMFAVIFFIWYPGPTFEIAGAMDIVWVLVGVDLVLGPLLTLIVYKKGKPSLKFDLAVIAIIQLSALVYGAHTFYQERPYYLVYVVDRFALTPERRIDKSKLKFDELKQKPFADVIKVFARKPEDPGKIQELLRSILEDGQPDLDARPEFWEPYSAGVSFILEQAKPLSALKTTSEKDKRRIQNVVDRYGAEHPNLGYVPIGSLRRDFGMALDLDTAEPLDIIKVDPW